MEQEVTKIADGELTKNEVVDKNLNLFCNKFSRFKARLADVNRFFEHKGNVNNQVHGQSGWQQNNHGNGFGGYDGYGGGKNNGKGGKNNNFNNGYGNDNFKGNGNKFGGKGGGFQQNKGKGFQQAQQFEDSWY